MCLFSSDSSPNSAKCAIHVLYPNWNKTGNPAYRLFLAAGRTAED